jgi:hypothetical protein
MMKFLAAIHPPDTDGATLGRCRRPARLPLVTTARRAAVPLFEPVPDRTRH